ncbi:Serine carboxypeptidase-like 19 [Triticum urartu]|uniref:Serine carboxypeptidase-like 19 n=1 Tax=Triticum urartu TaxID=4572 RepID=M7ZPJ1_TRIUA|nr:Serine carboxypeptidase-like 19 [Triticum urartu]
MNGRGRLLLCLFLSAALTPPRQLAVAGAASGSSSKVVTSLPGFQGRLPFHLETGYVEVDEENGTELFYYFVESEAGAEKAPFLLWLTGGDRCTVLSGLALEIGPFQFVAEPYNGTIPRLQINPYSWTKVANILFVDTPVGAGFSFSRRPQGYDVGEVSTSLQLHELLIKFFIDRPEFLANPLYIGGDSRAGQLVPFIAQKISEGIEAGRSPILNLKGYLVGNPGTGENIDISSRVPYAHGLGIISDQLYETILEHCQGEDYMNPRNTLCAQSLGTFDNLLSEVMAAQILLDNCVYASPRPGTETGKSAGAARKILSEEAVIVPGKRVKHPPPRVPLGCISYTAYLSYFWANDPLTRDALGIKDGTVDEWVRCHDGDLPYAVDIGSSIKYHRNVTVNGYRALVYSGDHDAIVPHLGTQAWVRSLGFPVVDDWRAWHLDGQSAGFTVAYSNNMTFATVKVGTFADRGAGHTAPQYEPERCYAMFNRWILDQPL